MATLQTVLGPVSSHEMGPTLSHVHLTLDILCWHAPPEDPKRQINLGGSEFKNRGRQRTTR